MSQQIGDRRHLAIEDELRGYISERDRRITDLEAKVAAAEDAIRASHELLLRSAEAIDQLQTDKVRLIEYVLIARPALPSFDDSALLLRDALLLSLRRGAGPFRSFGQISVQARDYQLVPR